MQVFDVVVFDVFCVVGVVDVVYYKELGGMVVVLCIVLLDEVVEQFMFDDVVFIVIIVDWVMFQLVEISFCVGGVVWIEGIGCWFKLVQKIYVDELMVVWEVVNV